MEAANACHTAMNGVITIRSAFICKVVLRSIVSNPFFSLIYKVPSGPEMIILLKLHLGTIIKPSARMRSEGYCSRSACQSVRPSVRLSVW